MKRLLLCIIMMTAVWALQAQQVTEQAARQAAARFFADKATRFTASAGQTPPVLAYTAQNNRFYIFNRAQAGGFVIVAGDERLPQVLGYGTTGAFSPSNIPVAMQDWMDEMNREISYLQSHSGATVHFPVKRATPVGPLMTTRWDQGAPYNNMCPTYSDGAARAVTGCIATATAQIMNYHQWPLQGTGSHSYTCRVNNTDATTLSANFSESFYQWDLMLDSYDAGSSQESCDAVAKLMSDVGIAVDMNYGSSSGASETAVVMALCRYFGYSDKRYLLQRDFFSADDWDQMLVDEISAHRPVLYCGYAYSQGSMGGHAFVFDGFDADGYFHVNWGWGGAYDNYFMVSLLAPSAGNDFKYGQDCIFGIVPAPRADEVPDVMYILGIMHPDAQSVTRGDEISIDFSDFYVQGNMLDTVGFETMWNRSIPYDTIPIELRVLDQNGNQRQSCRFNTQVFIDNWWSSSLGIAFTPDPSLEDGEYTLQVAYSPSKDTHFDSWITDEKGKASFCKMRLSGDMVYLSDCLLATKYDLETMAASRNIYVDEPFDVDVTLSYNGRYGPQGSTPAPTTGNMRVLLLADGQVVGSSEPVAISVPYNSSETYKVQMNAPAQWGRYQLMAVDESGHVFTPAMGWYDLDEPDGTINIVVVPKSDELVEDFETMTANSKTNETNVQGQFTVWNFNKSGVRAPGEGKCNGTNSVMMKKPSTFYSVEPLYHNFLMAAATFYNNSSADAKFTLEYTTDDGATWTKASTIEGGDVAIIPATSTVQAIWQLHLRSSDASRFRISMTGGSSAAVYVDDLILRYHDLQMAGDVNLDGEVNIADVNLTIGMILGGMGTNSADVNDDGEINLADVNAIINMIQTR